MFGSRFGFVLSLFSFSFLVCTTFFALDKTHGRPLVNLINNILDFNSYSGVPNGESNHENSGDGAPRTGGDRGRPQRRYQNNRGPRRSRNSESGGNGKPAAGEKVNNFDN